MVFWLLVGLGTVVFLVAGYAFFVLHWAYSSGERSGVLQKFSRRGWVVKTWEGELAMTTVPGVAPVLWNFTVRDEAAVAQVSAGLGKHVVLHYTEHRGIPSSIFGDTRYYVDGVRIVPDSAAMTPEM
jgi:hypothetical protein